MSDSSCAVRRSVEEDEDGEEAEVERCGHNTSTSSMNSTVPHCLALAVACANTALSFSSPSPATPVHTSVPSSVSRRKDR